MAITEHEEIVLQDVPAIVMKIEKALNDQDDFDDTGTQSISGAKTYEDAVTFEDVAAFEVAPDFEAGFEVAGVAVSATAAELNKLDGVSPIYAKEASFTETSGAGVYTAGIALPAGATIVDIIVAGVALWDNAGTATMKVGFNGGDDDAFYTGVNLKATDLLAGESLSFANAGGKAGANIHDTQVDGRYNAGAVTIDGVITTSSTGGTAGRTRMTVLYSAPPAGEVAAAVKV